MKKLTVLSPSPTYPVDFGNRKRILSICNAFKSRGFDVSFLFYPLDEDWRDNYSSVALKEMRSQWDEVELIVPSIPYHKSAVGKDHDIDEWWDPAIEAHLKWHFRSRFVDAFLVNYTFLSKAFEFAPANCLKLLDTHDRFGGRRQLLAQLDIAPEFFHTTTEGEAIGIDRADVVIAIKDEEKEYFSELSSHPVFTWPYFESAEKNVPEVKLRVPDHGIKIGIIGARNNINYRNVSAFLDVALPMFKEYLAPVTVVLAGGMCADLDDHAQNPYVEIIGRVEDVKEFYSMLDAVAVPMEVSTGQKIKVGEALSTGLPVFSHEHAFEGYKSPSHYHRYSSFEAMAEDIMKISFSPDVLKDVVTASAEAYRLQEDYFERSADDVIGFVRANSYKALFVLDANFLISDRITEANILSTVKLVHSVSRSIVAISGPVQNLDADFLQQLSTMSRIVSTDEGNCDGILISHVPEFSDLLSEFNIQSAWLYGNAHLAPICDLSVPVFFWPAISEPAMCEDIPVQYSSHNRLRLLTGQLERADSSFMLRNVSVLDLMPFETNALKKLDPEKRSLSEKSCAVFVSKEFQHWVPNIIQLLEAEGFNFKVFGIRRDIDNFREGLPAECHRYLAEVESIGSSRGAGTQGAFSKIIDLSDHSKARLYLEFCLAQQSMVTGQIAFWRFPRTATYRPLQILSEIRDYLRADPLNGNQNTQYRYSDGFAFLESYLSNLAAVGQKAT